MKVVSSMRESMRVYVSATTEDLQKHRRAVVETIHRMHHIAVCMQYYYPQDQKWVEKCLLDVATCDVYVGIFAWHYGSIPEGHDKSFTELEYRKAEEIGIPKLTFLLHEKVKWPAQHRDSAELGSKMNALRNELAASAGVFKNLTELTRDVQHAVTDVFVQMLKREMENRYAEISIPGDSEQADAVNREVILYREGLEQQSRHSKQAAREPIPIPLPTLRGAFVGRETQCNDLRSFLHDGSRKMVVVVGLGGYGKTEMTTKILKEVAPSTAIVDDEVKGILYLGCVGGNINLGMLFSMAGRIAGKAEEFRRIHADGEMTLEWKIGCLLHELSKVGRVWIVLDNFEDLMDQTDHSVVDPEIRRFLEILVTTEHNVRLIVTSRDVPQFDGSRKVELIPLGSGLEESEAVQYLREEGSEYGLEQESEEVLLALARRVDGIPKALESVLGYLDAHYPSIKLSDLLNDDQLFADFDRHDRENGLKKLIGEQLNNQSADALIVLSSLSVFQKPVPMAALYSLMPGAERPELAALLARLNRNRLLNQNEGYYDLHPIVRTLVYEQIPETRSAVSEVGEAQDCRVLARSSLHLRAAEFFRQIRKQKEELRTIEDLEPQLQEFYHLMQAGQFDVAARLLGTIDTNCLQRWGCAAKVVEMREQLIGKLSDPRLDGQNWQSLGNTYTEVGRVHDALKCFQETLELARKQVDPGREASALTSLGIVWAHLGDKDRAREHYELALDRAAKGTSRPLMAECLNNMGTVSRIDRAIKYYRVAAWIAHRANDRRGESNHLRQLGGAWREIGQTRKALDCCERALELAKAENHHTLERRALDSLGTAWAHMGDPEKAYGYHDQSLAMARDAGSRTAQAVSLVRLAEDALDRGRFDDALRQSQDAVGIARPTESRYAMFHALDGVARAQHYKCLLDDARKAYQDALDLDTGSWGLGSVLLLGIVCLEQGEQETCLAYVSRSVAECQSKLANAPELFQPRYYLGLGQLAVGQHGAALETYRRALQSCSSTGVVKRALQELGLLERAAPDTPGLKKARELLEAGTRDDGRMVREAS